MAFDLRASLRLDGNSFVRALQRITRATQQANNQTGLWRDSQGRLRDEMGRFARHTSNTTNSMNRFTRSLTSPIRSIGSLTNSLYGLAGAYAAVSGAQKIYDETILAAAKYEQGTITISAILNDQELGKQYMNLVDKFAIDSPILNSQDMLANSKSFLTMIKDIDHLEKAWSIAERMAAIDPFQGTEGAVFALREMFSGDAISMVRRFEFPKAVMNEIKKLDIPEQLEALNKYFNKIGMTQKLIDDMGGTTLGIWAQIKGQVQVILRSIGMPALKPIRDFLSKINHALRDVSDADKMLMRKMDPEGYAKMMENQLKIEKFKNIGSKMIKGIAEGFIAGVTGIASWIEAIQNSPEFQKQTTLFGKVEWVINDVYSNFLQWLDGGGQAKIAKVGSDLIQILGASVEASLNHIIPIATKVGGGIAQGVLAGFNSAIQSSWMFQVLQDPAGYAVKKLTGGKLDLTKYDKANKEMVKMSGKSGPLQYSKRGASHSSGLSRVPYNGYQATLHKGERVLTNEEAKQYNNSGGVTITGNTFNVRQESDIQKIAHELAKLIEREGVQMA